MPKKTFSIDKMIDERDEDFKFDEMTAQLAEKIVTEIPDETEDDDDSKYEDLKDIIRDHLVEWYETGDPMKRPKVDYRKSLARVIARLAAEKSGQDLEDAIIGLLPETRNSRSSIDDDEHK